MRLSGGIAATSGPHAGALRRTMVAASLGYCAYSIWCAFDRDLATWILETYDRPVTQFLAGVAAVVTYGAATLFVHRKKRLVLFLRKFRSSEATALIGATIKRRSSAAIRLVTLDDGKFAPRGAPVGTVVGSLALTAFGAVIGLMSIRLVGAVYAEDFGQFYWLPTVVAVACGFLIPSGGVGFLAFVTGLLGAHFIWRTRRMKTQSGDEVAAATRRLARLKSRARASDALAPRACVVTSSDEVWREAVAAIADVADIIVIDVSELSAALEWELAFVSANHRGKLLLIARDDELFAHASSVSVSKSIPAHPAARDAIVRFKRDVRGRPDPKSLTAALSERL